MHSGSKLMKWLVETKHFPESKITSPESKTRPSIQNHFPESKTRPRIRKHFPESKTRPRIQKCFGFWEVSSILGCAFGF